MKNNSEGIEQKVFSIARKLLASFWISFLLSAGFSIAIAYLESRFEWLLEWKWLLEDIFLRGLLTFSFLAIIVNMLTPGPLILVFPSLGYAWLRGGFRGFSAYKTWKEVPDGVAFWSLLVATVYFVFGMAFLYVLIINGWFGQTLISFVTSTKLFLSK